MNIYIDIKDRHGNNVELNQPVALKVYRRSGSWSNWWKRCNKNHFNNFWLPGTFKLFGMHVNFVPDKESEKALEQPMGDEKDTQCVDHINIDYFNPENLDASDVPESGTFVEIKE